MLSIPKKSVLTLAVCALNAALPSFASESADVVYVSATRDETAEVPVAAQIKVIDAEEIRVSGAKVITDVLRTQAGIQISDADGSGLRNVTVSMQGLSGANNVLVLVDGRKLNNPSMAAPALNTVALNDVERIEIIQGSAGVLYGDQAVGGVINVITRRATAGKTSGTVSATRGTGNLESYTASLSQGFENGLSYSASLQKRNTDNFRMNNQTVNENVFGNLRYDFLKGYTFVEAQHTDDNLRLAGPISDAQAKENPRATDTPNDFSHQLTKLVRVGGGYALTEQWKLLAEYSDRDESGDLFNDDYYSAPNAPLYSPSSTNSSLRVKSFTPRVVGSLESDNGLTLVTVGFDRVESIYNSVYSSKLYGNPKYNRDAEQTINGFYGQIIYPVTKSLSVTAGVRGSEVDNNNHHVSIINKDLPAEKQKPDSYTDKNTASDIGVNYKIDDQWSAFARIAEGFRYANPDDNGLVLPNVDFLKTQESQTNEIGFEWKKTNSSVRFSYFDMSIDNEIFYDAIIVNADSAFGGKGANVNLNKSERSGVILDSTLAVSNEVSLKVNYTYTDSAYLSGTFKGNTVPSVSKNAGNVSALFALPSDITLALSANYTGKLYRAGDDANKESLVEPVTTFDANLAWTYEGLEIAGRVKNITNEHYAGLNLSYGGGYYVQYPQPGRAYEVTATYRF